MPTKLVFALLCLALVGCAGEVDSGAAPELSAVGGGSVGGGSVGGGSVGGGSVGGGSAGGGSAGGGSVGGGSVGGGSVGGGSVGGGSVGGGSVGGGSVGGGSVFAVAFVATTGSDTNPCTQQSPCKTLNRAYRVATPGSAVEVAAGTYPGQTVSPDASKSGSTAPVVLQPAADAAVKINGTLSFQAPYLEARGFAAVTVDVSAHHITLRQMDFGYDPSLGTVSAGAFFTGAAAHDVLVEDTDFGPFCNGSAGQTCPNGAPATGNPAMVSIYPVSSDPGRPHHITFRRTRFHHSQRVASGDHTEGIAIWSADDVTIEDSRFEGCGVYCISTDVWLNTSPNGAQRFTLRNTDVDCVADQPGATNGCGGNHMGLHNMFGGTFVGNRFARSANVGYASAGYSFDVTFQDNSGNGFGVLCATSGVTCTGTNQ